MPQLEFIQDLVIIFGLSVGVVLVFQRLHLPSIAGFLLTGALVGPYGLNLIDDVGRVEVLAEVGVVLLLFTIGLEFSLAQLFRIRTFVLTGGSLQVGLTVLLTAVAALAWGLSYTVGIFWGFLVALSSTVIVLKILTDRRELGAPHGQLALGLLIFQDLIVVPMMFITPLLAGQLEGDLTDAAVILARSFLLIAVILLTARLLVPRILDVVVRTRSRELFVITTILICAGIAWLSQRYGLSLALGAFLAGLIISESEYSHQALADIMPFRDSFTCLFFVSIGMLLDVRFFMSEPFLIVGLALAVMLIKGLVSGGVTLALGYPLRVAVLVGLALTQMGEFSFILAQAGRQSGLLVETGFQLFLVISILTMISTPFLIRLGPRFSRGSESVARWLPAWLGERKNLDPGAPEPPKNHVLIAGYGLNGRNLARVLKEAGIPYAILDLRGEAVRRGQTLGEPVYFGDVGQPEVLNRMGICQARVFVIAITDPFAVRRAIQVAREANPSLHIVARTRYVKDVDELIHLGADEVVPEEFETSLEIFDLVLQQYQVPHGQILRKKDAIRLASYAKLREGEIETYIKKGNLPGPFEMEHYTLGASTPLAGQGLSQLWFLSNAGVNVLAVVRGSEIHSRPEDNFLLDAEDTLVLIGRRRKIREVIDHLHKSEEGEWGDPEGGGWVA